MNLFVVDAILYPTRYQLSVRSRGAWIKDKYLRKKGILFFTGTAVQGVIGNHGYVSEGIAGYCYPAPRSGLIPLYRYYQASVIDHFYTTNANEIGTTVHGQVGHHGYKSEGITCYVFKAWRNQM